MTQKREISRSDVTGDGDDVFEPRETPAAADLGGVTSAHLDRDLLLFLHPAGAGCVACDEARNSLG